MEYYEKKISFLGENIQIIRKHRGMKQQELANKIGINMQSLSKIERGGECARPRKSQWLRHRVAGRACRCG